MKKNILVVEDERPLAEAIKTKLEKEGFAVVSAVSFKQAVEYLEDVKIDGLWLDHYLLGEENGLDLVAKIKNDDRWKKMPIFVVSNTASAEKVSSYLELGIDKYFTKSDFRLDQIIQSIRTALE